MYSFTWLPARLPVVGRRMPPRLDAHPCCGRPGDLAFTMCLAQSSVSAVSRGSDASGQSQLTLAARKGVESSTLRSRGTVRPRHDALLLILNGGMNGTQNVTLSRQLRQFLSAFGTILMSDPLSCIRYDKEGIVMHIPNSTPGSLFYGVGK
jgi:hypothetical protein